MLAERADGLGAPAGRSFDHFVVLLYLSIAALTSAAAESSASFVEAGIGVDVYSGVVAPMLRLGVGARQKTWNSAME